PAKTWSGSLKTGARPATRRSLAAKNTPRESWTTRFLPAAIAALLSFTSSSPWMTPTANCSLTFYRTRTPNHDDSTRHVGGLGNECTHCRWSLRAEPYSPRRPSLSTNPTPVRAVPEREYFYRPHRFLDPDYVFGLGFNRPINLSPAGVTGVPAMFRCSEPFRGCRYPDRHSLRHLYCSTACIRCRGRNQRGRTLLSAPAECTPHSPRSTRCGPDTEHSRT